MKSPAYHLQNPLSINNLVKKSKEDKFDYAKFIDFLTSFYGNRYDLHREITKVITLLAQLHCHIPDNLEFNDNIDSAITFLSVIADSLSDY